ncbi:MAG: hypothetical protein R3C19_24910 [Planctomycetaceae bacterium]
MMPFLQLPASGLHSDQKRSDRDLHRRVSAAFFIAAGILVHSGCATSMLEQNIVEEFSAAIDEDNEAALRRIASTRFEEKAMRSRDALTDLQVVHLPTQDLKVVSVEEESENVRKVTVKEEAGGKYQFIIVRDPEKERWVVDDVMMRQRTKGTRITKSTTEVMDLLLTLREFLDIWSDGSREQILSMVSPELKHSLTDLPAEWMTALASRIAANYEDGMARKPEAQLNVDDAVVKLPAKQGYLLVSMIREDDTWLIDDIELISRREKEHPGSIRRQANAIACVTRFLSAYAAQDREGLQRVTERPLYDGSLQFADLTMVKLPTADSPPEEFDLRAFSDNLTVMMPSALDVVRFDLVEQPGSDPAAPSGSSRPFVVREVVLYERGTQRQRNLSSIFTAPTRATLFLGALQEVDVDVLAQISTTEFSQATWKRIRPDVAGMLPIPALPTSDLQLTNSNMQGQRTDLEFRAADGTILNCLLINENGTLKIDDVQYPDTSGQLLSLKTQLSLMTPLVEFASGWYEQNFDAVRMASSNNFNRLVWSNMQSVPQRSDIDLFALAGPVQSTHVTLDRATVVASRSPNRQITTTLVKEHGFWVVDEIELTDNSGHPIALRGSLREQVAQAMLQGLPPGNLTVGSQPSGSGDVVRPLYEVPSEARDKAPVSPAEHRQFVDGSARPQRVVSDAVYRRELTPGAPVRQPFGFPKDAGRGIQPLNAQPLNAQPLTSPPLNMSEERALRPLQQSTDAATGIQVFGPNAAEIAARRSSPLLELDAGDVPGSRLDAGVVDDSRSMLPGPVTPHSMQVGRSPAAQPAGGSVAGKAAARIQEPADQPIPLY